MILGDGKPVIAANLIVLALVGGMIGTTIGLIRTEEQRRIADAQKKKAEQAEADTLADYRASTDEAIEQLIGSKADLGPQEKAYLEKTLKRWQAFAARQGDDERSQAIRAEGHHRVAILWGNLGQRDAARTEFETARDLYKKLADAYAGIFRAFVKHHDAVKLVTFWGVNDANSWRANGKPLLFDGNSQPKPAFDAVIRAASGGQAQSPR